MAGLFPLSRMQQTDSNNNLLAGARLFLYDGGTSTPRIGYRDLALTSEHPNPILADAAGRLPLIYLDDGYYRQRLTSSTGTLVFDDDGIPVLTTTAGGAGTTVDPESIFKTGNLKIDFGDGVIDGYVRVNGRTIGSATSGATERANADTEPLYTKLWAFANIAVPAGKGASAAADFAANKTLTLPDCAGRAIYGSDDLGNGATNRISTISNPTLIGSPGGAQTVAIAQANIPSYSLTGGSGSVAATGTGSGTISGVATSSGGLNYLLYDGNSILYAAGGNTDAKPLNSGTNTAAVTGTATISSVSVTGTASSVSISSGGSGTAVNKLPPLMTFMVYMRL